MSYPIDHIDIVVTHNCNMKCPYCIDTFRGNAGEISLDSIDAFLKKIRSITDQKLEVLLLGGEPTCIDTDKLCSIAKKIKEYGFSPIISTNGIDRKAVLKILPYFDWIQITTHSEQETDYWRGVNVKYGNINLKLSGDQTLTLEKLNHFIDTTTDFTRRSVSMYFTPDFEELCKDDRVWSLLDSELLNWERNGSYLYAFYKGVRFKKCIPGKTNIIDEPTVPKLYPNGNYNRTWLNEDMDDYL